MRSLVGLCPALLVLTVIGCGGMDPISTQAGTGGAGATGTGGQGTGGEGAGGAGTGGQGTGGEGAGGAGSGGQGMGGTGAVGGAGGGGQGGTAACQDAPSSPCSAGWVLNRSTVCGYGGNPGTITCGPSTGDGLCYKECKTSGDCTDPCFSRCVLHFIFMSSDAGEPVWYCER